MPGVIRRLPILPEPEQPRRSLVVAPWRCNGGFITFLTIVFISWISQGYLPSLVHHLPVGSSWSISPNLFKEVSFHPIKHHHSAVQGASSHCALKAAKALLMIIRYSSVSPDHCAGTRNSICPLYWRKIVIRPDVLQTIPDCGFCIGFATSA